MNSLICWEVTTGWGTGVGLGFGFGVAASAEGFGEPKGVSVGEAVGESVASAKTFFLESPLFIEYRVITSPKTIKRRIEIIKFFI